MMETRVYADRAALGRAAASDIGAELRHLTRTRSSVRVMFASAPSQEETLRFLAREANIDWSAVTAFDMDEYVGLPGAAPQRFGNWLGRAFFDHVPVGCVDLIDPGEDPAREAARYTRRLLEAPLDIVILGIGVNGHLAFNDPPADLDDPATVRIVDLHQTSRVQQVQDGLFPNVEAVPRRALTVTVPCLLSASRVFCLVPGAAKAPAVRTALKGPVSGDCPASALRRHPLTTIYLDHESAPGDL